MEKRRYLFACLFIVAALASITLTEGCSDNSHHGDTIPLTDHRDTLPLTGTLTLSRGVHGPASSNISPYDTDVEIMQLRIGDSMGTIFSDDMESGTSSWTADSPWVQITSDYHSSTTCWTDSPSGEYANDLDISLTSIEFSLEFFTSATLTFWHHYDLETNYDYGYLEISTDGGASWTELRSFNGTQSSWIEEMIDISSYAGNSSVKTRFRLSTDESVTYDGWYIDDVQIQGPTGELSVEDVEITSITFTGSGTGDEVNDISLVELYLDTNNNGVLDLRDIQIGTGTFSLDDGTVTFGSLSEIKIAGAPQNWLVVYDFNGTASDERNFSLSLAANTDVTAIGVDSGQPITPTGGPVWGCTKTMGWVVETIDSPEFVGYYTSIALDSGNRPHISYSKYDVTSRVCDDLKYAYYDGSFWQIETVDSAGDVGGYTSIALDSNNRPHISYYDATNDDLKYAYFDGSFWQIETVDSAEDVGEWTSIALDTSDRPHISYYHRTNGDLKYAYFDGSFWQIETVDSAGDVGWFTSIALDTSNRPHISYRDFTNQSLKYAYFDGLSWQIETVDSGNVGAWSSIVLDTNDRSHISYLDSPGSRDLSLKYAYFDGSSWQIEIVDSDDGIVGIFTSIALDSNNLPHISYCKNIPGDLKYACFDGLSWQIETIDSAGYVGWWTSIALDSNNRPHISYCSYLSDNDYSGDLKYARK
jgi:hypothetical protein